MHSPKLSCCILFFLNRVRRILQTGRLSCILPKSLADFMHSPKSSSSYSYISLFLYRVRRIRRTLFKKKKIQQDNLGECIKSTGPHSPNSSSYSLLHFPLLRLSPEDPADRRTFLHSPKSLADLKKKKIQQDNLGKWLKSIGPHSSYSLLHFPRLGLSPDDPADRRTV